jgi:hypothetical protein
VAGPTITVDVIVFHNAGALWAATVPCDAAANAIVSSRQARSNVPTRALTRGLVNARKDRDDLNMRREVYHPLDHSRRAHLELTDASGHVTRSETSGFVLER